MHPELFELKALVAGRLDLHRRREIDDHLGSCADCSRHYVALMLGSSSPKTAEAEARESLVSTAATSVMAIAAGAVAAPAFGIDAPLAPSTRPAPKPAAPAQSAALETEFPAARTQVPVSASLVDAITKLRAESEAARVSADAATAAEFDAPSPVAEATPRLAPEIIAPEPESRLIAPSIFTPTPYDGVSLIHPPAPPAPKAAQPAPELVVTFSSTPVSTPRRSPASQPVTTAAAVSAPAPAVVPTTVASPSPEYVSMAVPTLASQPATAFEITTTAAPSKKAKGPMAGGIVAAAALVIVVGLAGFKFFQTSVDKAASAAAAEAAKKVEAAAAATAKPTAAPTAPAPVQTRIVYVEKPARKGEKAETKPETVMVAPAVPIAVTLPEVNLNTGADPMAQSNTQRAAANELTRSARATASRTAAPRP